MRQGIADALRRVSDIRDISGLSLVALLCASALAPVIAAGMAAGPVVLAGVGVAGSVGANVLTDVVAGVVERLRRGGKPVAAAALKAALAESLSKALEAPGDKTIELRSAVAELLRGVDAVSMAVTEIAGRDLDLLPLLIQGFAVLGDQFGEFAFIVEEVQRGVWAIEASLRQQQSMLRVQEERAREDSLDIVTDFGGSGAGQGA